MTLQQDVALPKVLAVDDSEVICALLRITLEQSGIQVSVAKSLEEAEQSAQKTQFDLIILDYMLGTDSNGLQLIERLQHTLNAATPVIMLSAEVETHIKQQAKRLGVKAWMKKPFTPHAISKLSRQILALD